MYILVMLFLSPYNFEIITILKISFNFQSNNIFSGWVQELNWKYYVYRSHTPCINNFENYPPMVFDSLYFSGLQM